MSFKLNSKYKKTIKYVAALIGISLAAFTFKNEYQPGTIGRIDLSFSYLLLSSVLASTAITLGAFGWHHAATSLKLTCKLKPNISTWLASLHLKYIPGAVWGYIPRLHYLRSENNSLKKISLCFFLESILVAATGLLTGFLALKNYANTKLLRVLTEHPYIVATVFVLVFIASVAAYRKHHILAHAVTHNLDLKQLSKTILVFIAIWVTYGCAFSVFTYSISQSLNPYQLLFCASCFALAFSASYVMVIFPSGIGVREIIIFTLLATEIPQDTALVVSILSRPWIIACEIIISLISLTVLKRFES